MALQIDAIPRPDGPRYTIFLAAKRTDPLLDSLPEHGWTTARDLHFEYVDGKPRNNKIVYRPVISSKLPIKKQNELQADRMREVIARVYHDGKWTIVVDELVWFDSKLKLRDDIETMLFKGRTEGISVIACAQRPAWISRFVYSQSDHIFLWNTNDREDRKSLGDISGIDRDETMAVLQNLDTSKHECAYICTRTNELMRVIAPPR
jgi:hypothetical protein